MLPRSIATKAAFENAMSLDIAMGGSTNTVLHLLAVAHEAGVDFTMQDIDRLSRRVPVLCKVAPNSHYHIQDVNRAGGIFAILGELDRAGLLDTSVLRVDGRTLGEAIPACDILNPAAADAARRRALSAPAGHYSRELGAQHSYYEEPDTDRTAGCIRDVEHAYFRDGGLAVLTGNIARNGCIVKTAASTSRPPLRGKSPRVRVAGIRLRRHSGRKGKRRRRRHHPLQRVPRAVPACRKCSTRPRI